MTEVRVPAHHIPKLNLGKLIAAMNKTESGDTSFGEDSKVMGS